MHGLVTSGHRLRQRQSARRRFRHGQRAAAVRAFTGARLYLNCAVPTLAAAVDSTGSCPAYIQAADHPAEGRQRLAYSRGPRWPRLDPAGGGAGAADGRSRHCLQAGQGPGLRGAFAPHLRTFERNLQRARGSAATEGIKAGAARGTWRSVEFCRNNSMSAAIDLETRVVPIQLNAVRREVLSSFQAGATGSYRRLSTGASTACSSQCKRYSLSGPYAASRCRPGGPDCVDRRRLNWRECDAREGHAMSPRAPSQPARPAETLRSRRAGSIHMHCRPVR